MATKTINEHEVILNAVKFPIEGAVRESLISRFPAAVRIGSPDYANEQLLSNWIINDQRGGMLIEEMDESVHADRYYWSNCDTRFRSNILLPKLATSVTIPTITDSTAASITNKDMEANSDWATITGTCDRSNLQAHAGTYSWSVAGAASVDGRAGQTATTWSTTWRGKICDFWCWIYCAFANLARIGIYDGQGTTWSDYHNGNSTWQLFHVTRTLDAAATLLRVDLGSVYSNGNTGYFDDAIFTLERHIDGDCNHFIEFNGKLYMAKGSVLTKLDADGDEFTNVYGFPAVITGLVQNGTNLFILIGDDDAYWYMTTAEALTQTNITAATKGIWWSDKLFVFSSAGACKYSAAPASATPSFTANGSLPVADNELQEVKAYFDANGNDIIYCSTKVGNFAHDYANAKFLRTAVKVPSHPTAGKGFVVWEDSLWTSAGLSVIKYIAGSTATVDFKKGLDQDDGLPLEHGGEIVKFIEGYNEFFALIDSTYIGVSDRSQVVSYDGRGWRTWWRCASDNINMDSGIVSSVYAYRLWFSVSTSANVKTVYYMPLNRNLLNPKKVSGYTYDADGVHVTPRFDAGTKAFPKLATKLTLFLDDMTSTEKVTVTYQIDQTAGAILSAWTALGSALTSDGKSEISFGSSAGIVFYDIQFKFALARGSTNTKSPIIKGAVLSYLKLLGRKKAWSFTINLNEAEHIGTKPKVLYDALATILGLNTLMTFNFRDGSVAGDTHYVMVQPYYGFTPTGQFWEGKYDVTVIEP